ncbi:trans-sulfuration enzyme family protein [Butyrivibrio sp. VCB2006]|uniref:trans-sulfuration enzyme family protein n=1 Tax=Butyrivibrio sp. VCB2006 TaxID=1280679 RepID=UPI0004138517|nr:PLP-dependent aspartate aminotransferase family protein [Butyrivibrio sp. VCB2006]
MSELNVDCNCRENTLIARGSGIFDETGSISVPVYRSATYVHSSLEHDPEDFSYARCNTPTRRALEKQVAVLEHGADALAVTSGLAALDAVLRLFEPGDRIIVSSDLYGGSYRLFDQVYSKYGYLFSFVDTWDIEAVRAAATDDVKGFIIETPSNPMLRISDIKAISQIAHDKNALLIVDNTFLSPLLQKPIELGADIVIHSATKFLAGHHDVLAGVIVTATKELREKLYFYVFATGNPLSPDDCWLTLRGMETLSVRLERQQQNAKALADYLKSLPNVKRVIYPGDEEHPDHKLAKRQQAGFGSMISFEIKDASKAPSYFAKFKLIYQAGSLGGVQSLINLPNASLQRPIPEEQRKRTGVTDGIFRLSVGIEDVEDLKEDLRQALA